MNVLLVGIGGALGSIARHGVGVAIARAAPAGVTPYATMAVNLAGCLVIGVLAGLVASHRLVLAPGMRAFVFVGVLGGFTTFSAFSLELVMLMQRGQFGYAALYLILSVALGVTGLIFGLAVMRLTA